MFKGMTDLMSMMRQAKQLGGKLEGMRQDMRRVRVRGEAGGGMVVVEMNGLGELVKVEISDDLVARQDAEMISSLIVAAAGQAHEKAREQEFSGYAQIASALGLDQLPNFFQTPSGDNGDETDGSQGDNRTT